MKIGKTYKASQLKGLDKYSNVYCSVDWEEASVGLLWHNSCKIEICGERKLQQALNRKRKNDAKAVKAEVQIERLSVPPGKATRQSVGVVHQKNLCIWFMKEDDSSKHPKRDKFYKICEGKFWKKFKASVMYVQDPELKLSLQTVSILYPIHSP